MARGRFVSKTISLDAKVALLSGPMVQLLWTWMIPHVDATGHFYGDAAIVRGLVFPRQPVSTEEVDGYLDEMHKAGLLVRYQVDGEEYLHFPNFSKHQVGLRPDREAASVIPPWGGETPPDDKDDTGATPEEIPTDDGALTDEIQTGDGTTPEGIPPNVKVNVKKKLRKEEEKKGKSDFLSQTPKSHRERIQDALTDILRNGIAITSPKQARTWSDAIDTLVLEFQEIHDKKTLDHDLTSKILAAIQTAYAAKGKAYPFQGNRTPNIPIIDCIVDAGIEVKDKAAAHSASSALAELSQQALAARQAEPAQERDPWWDGVLTELALQMTTLTFNDLLKDTELLERQDGRILIGVANEAAKDWLENRLLGTIKRAVAADGVDKVEFIVSPAQEILE